MEKVLLNDDALNDVSGGAVVPFAVQNGETLVKVAQETGVPVEKLMLWNSISDPNAPVIGKIFIKR